MVVGVAVLIVPAAAVTAPLVCGVVVVDRDLAVVVAERPASAEMVSVSLSNGGTAVTKPSTKKLLILD